jgi:cytoskeletal protein CcmA (bactofilin family)
VTTRRAARAALALGATIFLAGAAPAQELDDLLVKKGVLRGDQYLAGGTVDVHGKVEGDLTMAAVQAGLDGIVTGDVAAVGALVHVGGLVGDDVRALGGQVIIQGSVGDGLLVGGGEILLTHGTRVGGDAILGGRRVVDLGDVTGNLTAVAQYVEIAGDVGGRTTIRADEIVIGPKARLSGDLIVRGPHRPRIADGARIDGKVVMDEPPPPGAWQRLREMGRVVAVQLGLLLVAWAWMATAPRVSREAAAVEWRQAWSIPGIGVAVLFGLPLVAVLLAITVIGIPVAVGIAAVWVILLLAGYASTAICLGRWLRTLRRGDGAEATLRAILPWTFLALLLLRGAQAIPWVGVGVTIGAVGFGAGAVARAAQQAHWRGRVSRGPPGPGAA